MQSYIHILFIKHKNQIKKGGYRIILKKIFNLLKQSYKIFFYLIATIFFLIQIILSPFIIIRIGRLRNDKFGHITLEIELYLSEIENKINLPKKKFLDFFYKDSFISNSYFIKMRKRNIKILPNFIFKELFQINLLFGKKFICAPCCSDRDVLNLLDKSNSKIIFTNKENEIGKQFLKKIGLNEKPYVCLIVRDASYFGYKPFSDYRNANINNFVKAIEYLNSNGIYVIRMGAKKCPKIKLQNEKFIDYANSGLRNEFLDIFLGANCLFSMGTSTGFDGIPISSRKPALITNYVPIGYFPSWAPNQLVIFKHHKNSLTKKKISLKEIINNGLALNLDGKEFEHKGIELLENSQEEILDATIEMFERIKKKWDKKEQEEDLMNNFLNIYPININDRAGNRLHGKINSKIGYYFLKKNSYFLSKN